MTDDTSIPKGVPFDPVQHIAFADGSVVSKVLIKKEKGNITLFSFDKGQGLSEHTAPFDALVYVIDGEGEITIGGKKNKVTAGEMLIMPANIAHEIQAPKPFKMLLVMIRGE
jgi:quercetin dioxygenase-like cupin family protein